MSSAPSAPIPRPTADAPSGWSERELATLASLAETFVRGGATRRAGLLAQAIDRLDPAQSRQLRLLLRLVENRPANLLLAGRWSTLRDLGPADRERYLVRWGGSRLALRRSAYQVFKRLSCFLAYADPGEAVVNPLWATIGYRAPIQPVTDQPTPIVPFDPGPPTGRDGVVTVEADACIVGSGAGGGLIAAELAQAGRAVVVLEAGPFAAEPDMPTDELAAYDRLYLDHGLTASWDGAVSILAGSSVGGGTTINWMTCLPVQPSVRAAWARDHGLDGIHGAEFDDDVAAIEAEMGVTGPPNVPPKDAAILRGAAALGWEAAETRRNGVGCGDCGACPFGCRRGARQGGLRVHLAEAWRHGARIVPGAVARRVLIEGGRATAVEAVLEDGRRLVVRAGQVVVAAGALRTPGILERSGLDHEAIGRNLRLHPVSVVGVRMPDPVTMWSGTLQAARSVEFLEPRSAGGSGFVIESVPAHPGLIAQALPWESTDGHAGLMSRVTHLAPLIAITRDLGSGTVRTTKGGSTRIDYRVGTADAATLRRGLVEMARLGRAAGGLQLAAFGTPPAWFGTERSTAPGPEPAFEAYLERLAGFDFGPNRGSVFSAHQMGTARMGSDPVDHPVDERGRVRRDRAGAIVRGLYVGDASLFPTAIGVNPMITVMALARRTARTVLAEG
ncbi:MAG: GMC family oxidoreductase N-terminal domain-containing protein [Candidatus Limnocylindrales bacterium]